MDLKKLFMNMAILGLFVFGIMAFIITTQSENNAIIPITNNPLIGETYGNLSLELSSAQPGMEKAGAVFVNGTPTQQFGQLEIFPIISPTKTLRTLTVGLWNVLIKLPMIILGFPPIVIGIISAILIMLGIIGAWAIWKGVIAQ